MNPHCTHQLFSCSFLLLFFLGSIELVLPQNVGFFFFLLISFLFFLFLSPPF